MWSLWAGRTAAAGAHTEEVPTSLLKADGLLFSAV